MQNEYSAGRSGTATGGVGGAVYHATRVIYAVAIPHSGAGR